MGLFISIFDLPFLPPIVLLPLLLSLTLILIILPLYRLYMHPLSHIPGPPLWIISRLPFAYNLVLGRLPYTISSIHAKYGPVVRLAPNEISFITEEAWDDIYTVQKGMDGRRIQMQKDPLLFLRPEEGSFDMLFEYDDKEHARHRRIFSHAFSNRTLREQEPIIQQHISKMVGKLSEVCDKRVDMSAWFNYVLFDTVGDLVVGETFDCLETQSLHPWAKTFFSFAKGITIMGMTQRFWPLTPILMFFVPEEMQEAETELRVFTKDRVEARLAKTDAKKDIISHIKPHLFPLPSTQTITPTELYHNTQILVVGGSETTATTLSGALYFLLSNPRTLTLLTHELRTLFPTSDSITLSSIRSAPHLTAVLHETFRLFSPFAGLLRRITPKEGCVSSGVYVPGNTTVAVNSYAASHSGGNFHDAEMFVPERWLEPRDPATVYPDGYDEDSFMGDRKGVVRPFGVGPRNCVGMKLGRAVLALVAARLVWGFDFEFVDVEEGGRWMEGVEVYVWYERPPLMCRLKPRGKGGNAVDG
ncbi:hypothetical protein VTL71DRAFT_855 [Oculimacula yallundae]|uniref:Cytochrome P450 n=1 Tax=Oculimacula yallundae TaxID=86028 RepID=A0ABR4D188_9HELO